MDDSRSVVEHGKAAGPVPRSRWLPWACAVGGGGFAGGLLAVSGYAAGYLAPVFGFLVGVTCALVADSYRFLWGLLGVTTAVGTLLAIVLYQYWGVPHTVPIWFVVVASCIIVIVPGAAGAGLIAIRRRRANRMAGQ